MWSTTVASCDGTGTSRWPISASLASNPRRSSASGPRAHDASLEDLFEPWTGWPPDSRSCSRTCPTGSSLRRRPWPTAALHARLLVGRKVPIAALARNADQLHRALAGARVRLHKNGELAEEGAGANVLDSPLQALMHFLVELRSCPGATDVVAGDIVTTGTWTDAWPVRPGETWTARFDSALPPLEVASKARRRRDDHLPTDRTDRSAGRRSTQIVIRLALPPSGGGVDAQRALDHQPFQWHAALAGGRPVSPTMGPEAPPASQRWPATRLRLPWCRTASNDTAGRDQSCARLTRSAHRGRQSLAQSIARWPAKPLSCPLPARRPVAPDGRHRCREAPSTRHSTASRGRTA